MTNTTVRTAGCMMETSRSTAGASPVSGAILSNGTRSNDTTPSNPAASRWEPTRNTWVLLAFLPSEVVPEFIPVREEGDSVTECVKVGDHHPHHHHQSDAKHYRRCIAVLSRQSELLVHLGGALAVQEESRSASR